MNKITNLNEICDIIGDGLHGTPVFSDQGEYCFINGNNLSNGKIQINKDTKKCDNSQYLLYNKDLNDRTILLSINGTIGNLAFYNGEKVILGKSACYLNIKQEYVKKYMYYVFLNDDFQKYIKQYATGTTIKNVGLTTIREYTLNLPNYPQQKAIADVLSSFDDKIENNNTIIKNLEEQAQALYKHWFVDFEFPDDNGKPYKSNGGKFKDTELGFIPENWDACEIGKVCNRLTQRIKNEKLVVFSAVNTGELVPSSEYFDKQVFSNTTDKYIRVPQKAFAYNPARANIGSIGMNKYDYDGCVSPVYVAIQFEQDYEWFWEYLIKSESFKNLIKIRSSGSVRQNFDFDSFKSIMIKYPNKPIVNKFNQIFLNLYNSINKLKEENQKLKETRDYLLPKLMSGEIKVENI